ncbi:PREDICTED: zinc finger protein 503 [Mandrillus leucophaeus]|uniref:zinc finger protein 503 n=1 Tax=Mandrillus leucophaeus TaxID=9568 RepID=UPI0005F42AF9|nr:PREDICTED: zinc finger protein 503 [Mandrillus leucophaeus]
MSTAPSLSALRSSKHSGGGGGGGGGADPAWTSALSGNSSGPGPGSSPAGSTKPFVHAVPPSDPLRQANRLPIKVLKMLTARTGHILHPEYLQPLPSTPVSPIEVRTLSLDRTGTTTLVATLGLSFSRHVGGGGGVGVIQLPNGGRGYCFRTSKLGRKRGRKWNGASRYHPYSKSPLPTPGAPVPVPAATGPYYSPYALYGQRLTTASALGYQ